MKFDNTVKIAPSILSADFSNFGAEGGQIVSAFSFLIIETNGWILSLI